MEKVNRAARYPDVDILSVALRDAKRRLLVMVEALDAVQVRQNPFGTYVATPDARRSVAELRDHLSDIIYAIDDNRTIKVRQDLATLVRSVDQNPVWRMAANEAGIMKRLLRLGGNGALNVSR